MSGIFSCIFYDCHSRVGKNTNQNAFYSRSAFSSNLAGFESQNFSSLSQTAMGVLLVSLTKITVTIKLNRPSKNVGIIPAGTKNKNLLLSHYSHFQPALEEAKNVARILSPFFENNMLKNQTTELATNTTTTHTHFLKAPYVDHQGNM